jgi:predicted chitinase
MTDQQKASQRLHYAINRAADEYGRPLPAGQAMFIAQKLMQDLPTIVEAIANSAQGKAT